MLMASQPPEPAGAAGLESLEGLVLDTIIARAGARPAAALACTSALLRATVAEDVLWRRFCADDLGLDAPLDPKGRPLPSFKGVLRDGLVVAIKKFHNSSLELSDNQLGGEVHHLFSMLEHKNIVRVLGYCRESSETSALHQNGSVLAEERITLLVKEYAPNGTLEKIIKGSQLDWSSRFRIIQGIAQGVHYLHSAEKPVFHLDLKPENILLDSDMNPKIDDFGIARLLASEGTKTQDFVGTVGYMPPEYIMHGAISAKNDVYSFGIILLETISGMSKSKDSKPARHHASIAWAWAARKARRMNELFDPSLCEESQLKGIKRCMEIGLLCTQENPRDRPTMAEVVEMLNGEKKLPTPKQPGYTKDRS